TELMTPLVRRAYNILRRRGEVPDVGIDGRLVALDFRSPLARAQGQRNIQNTLFWLQSVQAMGPSALAAVNLPQAARILADALGVPSDLIAHDNGVTTRNLSSPRNRSALRRICSATRIRRCLTTSTASSPAASRPKTAAASSRISRS